MLLPGQASQRHLSRRTYKMAIAGSLLVVASATGFNAAMIAGFVADPLALLAFVSAAKKWDGYTRKMVIGAILLASGPVSCSIQSRLLELRLQPVIPVLKTYRDSNDSYLDLLDKLVPDHLESVPSCPNRRIISFTRKEADTAQFSLSCKNTRMTLLLELGRIGIRGTGLPLMWWD